jgi:hypothetical protein
MQSRDLILAALAGALFVVGCNRAEAPGEMQEDVAAQQDAADEAREQVAQGYPPSTPARGTPQQAGGSQYDLAIADAEAAHKVARKTCGSLATKEQQACNDRADDELAVARAQAESLRLESPVKR